MFGVVLGAKQQEGAGAASAASSAAARASSASPSVVSSSVIWENEWRGKLFLGEAQKSGNGRAESGRRGWFPTNFPPPSLSSPSFAVCTNDQQKRTKIELFAAFAITPFLVSYAVLSAPRSIFVPPPFPSPFPPVVVWPVSPLEREKRERSTDFPALASCPSSAWPHFLRKLFFLEEGIWTFGPKCFPAQRAKTNLLPPPDPFPLLVPKKNNRAALHAARVSKQRERERGAAETTLLVRTSSSSYPLLPPRPQSPYQCSCLYIS